MIRVSLRRLVVLAGVATLLAIGFTMTGSGAEFGLWQKIGLATGTPDDSRPADFAQLERRTSPNDALICPAGICPRAAADIEPPVYTIPAERLREKLRTAALKEPRVQELRSDPEPNRLRFVQRSALLRYPDVIDVLVVPHGNGASTLAIWSRSLVGRRDFGVNRARVERWLEALSK